MLTQKNILAIGAIFGALAVSIGAFGAHALKPLLIEYGRLDTFELAVKYHFYHTLALFVSGWIMEKFPGRLPRLSAMAFISGIILFSGSLYLLSLTNITKVAIVTPFGGVFFIGGWILLLATVLSEKKN